ncbi:MAG TPA: helix-turn-helix domain-containing protein [Candidatus Dormibacteraeota bacterium]|jgi:AcrR family transcriptional regulator|nr:helix-turn-helix domain-containing protein [Candidatus Dormibacteraeota bacterium]
MRADAQRNQDRIVAGARELFAERGFEVAMEEIARQAGVGVGTLYRRFPDRWTLVRAVSVDALLQLGEAARSALEEEADAWSALRRLLLRGAEERFGALQALDAATHQAIRADPDVTAACRELITTLARIVEDAKAVGDLRTDVGPGDILLLLVLLTRPLSALPADVGAAIPVRYLHLALDGLRPSATSLPGSPIRST